MQTPERADLLPLLADLDGDRFWEVAEAVFRYQAVHNPLYARYLELLDRFPSTLYPLPSTVHRPPSTVHPLPSTVHPLPSTVYRLPSTVYRLPSTVYRLPSTVYRLPSTVNRQPSTVHRPPFLPIQFFKTQKVTTGSWTPQTVFTSSATTGQTPSRHYVRDLDFYLENARRGFARFYGDPSEWRILALLPSYLERGGSSLVAMADYFIQQSRYPESGFFLHDFERLREALAHCQSNNYKTLLLGVSFALLDFSERFPMDLSGITVMETGGMKGRRRELTRPELHEKLCVAFHLDEIHSEYGMTELFSQAYAQGDTLFAPAPTMRVLATEINDPFCPVAPGRTGVLNIIDLANLDTCSFIQTEDVGKVYTDGRFEVLGRLDVAELRGCNLMVE